jgi:hypothetical protein
MLASWLNGLKSRISGRVFERSVVSPRRQRRPVARFVNSLEPRTLLAAVMWDGGGGDFQWSNPLNWDTDTLPGEGDDVTIEFGANDFTVVHSGGTNSIKSLTSVAALDIAGGTLLVNSASTVDGDLQLSGTLGGTADIDVSGLFTWNNGTLVGVGGHGSLTANGGTAIVANSHSEMRGGFRYVNPAGQTATWTGNRAIFLSDRSIFQNDGTLDLQQSGTGVGDRDDMSEFINTGTVLKSQSAGESFFTTGVIINSGLIDVQSGDLYLGYYEPSQTTNTGTIHGALDTTIFVFSGLDSSGTIDADRVQFLHGTQSISGEFAANDTQVYRSDVTMTGTIASLGALGVDGATLNLTAATFMSGGETLDSLNLNGTLVTDEDLTVSGLFTWNNGSLVGVGGHGSLTISQDTIWGNNLTVRNFTLINAANMTWTGGTVQFFGTTGGFVNAAGATFTNTFDGTFGSVDGNCLRFVNEGHFVKTGGTGITYLQMLLYNRGTVEIQQGQLYLGCGYVGTPGNPPPPGVDPGPRLPIYEDPDPRELPSGDTPLIIPGSYTQTVTGVLIVQIAGHTPPGEFGVPGTDYGQLVVNGNVALAGTFGVELLNGFQPAAGTKFLVLNNLGDQLIDGIFSGFAEGAEFTVGTTIFTISYVGGNGNDVVVTAMGQVRTYSLSGYVFVDQNNDGLINMGETAIEGVRIVLTNEQGVFVAEAFTDAQGSYTFSGLAEGRYFVTQIQPNGYLQGINSVGSLGGSLSDIDQFFVDFSLAGTESDGFNYNFAELLPSTGALQPGQTASIGFWHNKHGQALIKAVNGGAQSTQLSTWLASNFPNMYGSAAGSSNLTGMTNAQVAAFYLELFKRNAKSSPGGPPKTDAQVLATALAVYLTNSSLAGNVATAYGFQVSASGAGAATFNVTNNGAAFGVANGSTVTIMNLLLALNDRTRRGLLFDLDNSGTISNTEKALREMGNSVFSAINETGDN